MKLMMVCPTCNGQGMVGTIELETFDCYDCHGTGVVAPPQQILDDLECAEIERELLEKAFRLDVYTLNGLETELQVTPWFENNDKSFIGKTKLEVYRKAKNWMVTK